MSDWRYTRGDGTDDGDRREYRDPRTDRVERQIRCCGKWLDLSGFTNTCDGCAADYNFAGQRLAPRSQWGEETGESVDEILAIDNEFDNSDLY